MAKKTEGRYYTAEFYRELAVAQESARDVLPIVFECIKPLSVIDIGCGTGHWLVAARELGVKEILGVDGAWVDKAELAIPAENFIAKDLTAALNLRRRFDLALSFEVGEHLPESAARTFVQSLCAASDVVAFSAAIPGQGGRHHLNEQWPSYWANLFRELEYDCFDYLRPRIWDNPRVEWYYAQNSLIFVRSGVAHPFGEPVSPMPLVHPVLWSAEVARSSHPGKLLERFIKTVFSSARPEPRKP